METRRWWPDEVAHAGEEHLDPSYVRGYDEKAGFDPATEVALLRDVGLTEASSLVDVGAGTGTLALAAAPYCQRVVAVDVSPAMVERLRRAVGQGGLDHVECVEGGFLSYAHRGEPADVVFSRNALHHLPDAWKAVALTRIAAMLRPGGVLRLHDLVYSCEPGEVGAVVEAWLGSAAADARRGWTRTELETHVREEHSTFDWLLEPMLERAGFAIRAARHHARRVYSTYTCVKSG